MLVMSERVLGVCFLECGVCGRGFVICSRLVLPTFGGVCEVSSALLPDIGLEGLGLVPRENVVARKAVDLSPTFFHVCERLCGLQRLSVSHLREKVGWWARGEPGCSFGDATALQFLVRSVWGRGGSGESVSVTLLSCPAWSMQACSGCPRSRGSSCWRWHSCPW